MCSMIGSGEKGYKLPEQILFNSLVLYLTLHRSPARYVWDFSHSLFVKQV